MIRNHINELIMFKLTRILFILVMLFVMSPSVKADDQKIFEPISEMDNVSYSYLSPKMLTVMGDMFIKDTGIRVQVGKLTSLYNVQAYDKTTAKVLTDIGQKLIRKYGMDVLAKEKTPGFSTVTYGKFSDKDDSLSHLMYIKNIGNDMTILIYMTGSVSLNGYHGGVDIHASIPAGMSDVDFMGLESLMSFVTLRTLESLKSLESLESLE